MFFLVSLCTKDQDFCDPKIKVEKRPNVLRIFEESKKNQERTILRMVCLSDEILEQLI